ncbi:MAG: glutathione synthase [Gammaproteobacteria bacterium]|nr:glutathione synthase [Gammaproteobacteria bacterium]
MSSQKKRLAVVMDPIEHITPYKDTTLAFLLEATRRDWTLEYLELGGLYLRDGKAFGQAASLAVRDSTDDWFDRGDHRELPLGDFDVILMRKDPPFDLEFFYATHILEQAERDGALVVNRPRSLRDVNEKLAITQFPQCCAPTLVTRSIGRLRAFLAEQEHIVVKPLDGMGGAEVFVVRPGDPNTSMIFESITRNETRQIMAQRFIPEIAAGDKRILLVDGEPFDHALARIPAEGESRGNLAAGGRGEGVPLTERDRWICSEVSAWAKEQGLLFVGLDVIGDYLTEINVTSPTCVRELDAQYDANIAALLFDAIEQRLP